MLNHFTRSRSNGGPRGSVAQQPAHAGGHDAAAGGEEWRGLRLRRGVFDVKCHSNTLVTRGAQIKRIAFANRWPVLVAPAPRGANTNALAPVAV